MGLMRDGHESFWIWAQGRLGESDRLDAELEAVSRELEAIRWRLDHAAEWFSNARASIRIAALSKEIERIARQASNADSPMKRSELIAEARQMLDEMQQELGSQ